MQKTTTTTTVIEEYCKVAPPPDAKAELSLTLTHSDITWLPSITSKILLFYEFPCSKTYFLQTIVPNLKNSLSLTLKHFLPMAGKLFLPLDSGLPFCRYTKGDLVPVVIAISDSDFIHLTGNHARNSDEFHAFVPHLPPHVDHSPEELIEIHPFALQITLFPNKGVSIGLTICHSLCDGASLINFINTWASITKSKRDIDTQSCDRATFQDLDGLASISWNHVKSKMTRPLLAPTSSSTNKVRATFILVKDDIQKLKDIVLEKRPNIIYVSSFTVACAHVWSSIMKVEDIVKDQEVVDINEPVYFIFMADCRGRLNPPLPYTYFGNCLVPMMVKLSRGILKGSEGFVEAVEAIGETIRRTVYNEKGIYDSMRNSLMAYVNSESLIGRKILFVAGSPRLDIYGVDFGWGKMKKYESVSIDQNTSMSIYKSKEIEGGLEIGFTGSSIEMNAFTTIFQKGLSSKNSLVI